ncbi:MAG TPA: WD40 repeat domain-containing protein [Candidatus Limnocylindrales bacterium]|nr:WD40 repeat domain-containing protein [Candidatus Limnocylindrales bacterium]
MKRRLMFFALLAVLLLAALPAAAQSEPIVISTTFIKPRVEVSPDGSKLAVFEDASLARAIEITPTPDSTAALLFDPATGDLITSLTGSRDHLASLIFTPDGTQVIGLAANGDVLTWDSTSGELIGEARIPLLADRSPLFWHPQTGELVVAIQNLTHTTYVTLDPATGAQTFLAYNLPITTFSEWWAWQGERGSLIYNDAVIVPFPQSEALADLPMAGDEVWTVNPQGQIALLSLGSGERQVLRQGDDIPMFNINYLVATPSGLIGFTVERENTVNLFNLTNGEETVIQAEHQSAQLSPDGAQIAQYNADETALLVSPVEGGETQGLTFPDGLTAGSTGGLRLRYSPDGSRLVALGLRDTDEQLQVVIYDL